MKPEFDDIEKKVLSGCMAQATCHDSEYEAGGLVLEEGLAYAELVGVPDAGVVAEGDDRPTPDAVPIDRIRVIPFDPDNSYLMDKIEENLASNEGERMPNIAGERLRPAEIEAIREWIANGALP